MKQHHRLPSTPSPSIMISTTVTTMRIKMYLERERTRENERGRSKDWENGEKNLNSKSHCSRLNIDRRTIKANELDPILLIILPSQQNCPHIRIIVCSNWRAHIYTIAIKWCARFTVRLLPTFVPSTDFNVIFYPLEIIPHTETPTLSLLRLL